MNGAIDIVSDAATGVESILLTPGETAGTGLDEVPHPPPKQ